MAEIDIQKRERAVWPWILAAVLLVLFLLWWFLWRADPLEEQALVTAPDTTVAATAGVIDESGRAVSEFQTFVNERQADFGLSHEHTAEGLRRLAAALESTISRDTIGSAAVAPRIAQLRQQADAIEREPQSLRHAEMVRQAMIAGAGLIQDVGARGGRTMDSGSVSAAAEAIDTNRPLLEQTDTITRFFNAAATALGDAGTAR